MTNINLWANFLYNEKFDSKYLETENVLKLMKLCEKMAAERGPLIRQYKDKLESRKFVCRTAIELEIDLAAMRNTYTGKLIIGRGLLDMWNKVLAEKFGACIGTNSWLEAKRRDVVTRLANKEKGLISVRCQIVQSEKGFEGIIININSHKTIYNTGFMSCIEDANGFMKSMILKNGWVIK